MQKKLPFAQYALKDLVVYSIILVILVLGLVLAAILFKLWWLLVPTALVFGLLAFVVSFFRDPEREIPQDKNVLVSPADGTVRDIETLPRGDARNLLNVPAVRIGIFLSLFNVHVNRTPLAGQVSRVEYRRGSFLPAYDPRASSQNESNTIWVEDAGRALTVAVKQISGVAARRIVCPTQPGDRLERGQRYGMIKFGSRTELYVPQDAVAEILVQVGAKVRGGTVCLVQLKAR